MLSRDSKSKHGRHDKAMPRVNGKQNTLAHVMTVCLKYCIFTKVFP